MKRFTPLAIFVALAILLAAALLLNPQREQEALSGKAQNTPLPILTLFTRDGDPVILQPDSLEGHVVLINFFASWCTPCEEEHKVLLDVSHAPEAPTVLGIAWNDTVSRTEDFLAQHRDPYTRVLFDSKGRAAIALGVRGLPESFIVDKHGVVRYHLTGPLTEDMYSRMIRPLLIKLEHDA